MTQPINLDDAIQQYGVVGQIVNAIPELKDALTWAIQHQASQDALNAKIAQTPWYQQHADPLRNLLFQAASDPATYAQNLANAKNQVGLKARELGRYYTDADLSTLALTTMATNPNFDNGILSELLSTRLGLRGNMTDGIREGTAAQYADHFTQVAQDYGVPYSQDFLDSWVTKVQEGFDTTDGFESLMRSRAKATFPQFAAQIDAGLTVRQIADPYMAQMANTLELPQTSVKLNDPYIQKALSNLDPKTGAQSAIPMWQFQQQLKQDPRYDQTAQAKTDAYTTLAKVGKDFGFSS